MSPRTSSRALSLSRFLAWPRSLRGRSHILGGRRDALPLAGSGSARPRRALGDLSLHHRAGARRIFDELRECSGECSMSSTIFKSCSPRLASRLGPDRRAVARVSSAGVETPPPASVRTLCLIIAPKVSSTSVERHCSLIGRMLDEAPPAGLRTARILFSSVAGRSLSLPSTSVGRRFLSHRVGARGPLSGSWEGAPPPLPASLPSLAGSRTLSSV